MKPGVLALEPYLKEVVWGSDRLQKGWRKGAPLDVKLLPPLESATDGRASVDHRDIFLT